MLNGLAEGYSASLRERSEELRNSLGGIWLAVSAVLLVARLAVGTGTAFGRVSPRRSSPCR